MKSSFAKCVNRHTKPSYALTVICVNRHTKKWISNVSTKFADCFLFCLEKSFPHIIYANICIYLQRALFQNISPNFAFGLQT